MVATGPHVIFYCPRSAFRVPSTERKCRSGSGRIWSRFNVPFSVYAPLDKEDSIHIIKLSVHRTIFSTKRHGTKWSLTAATMTGFARQTECGPSVLDFWRSLLSPAESLQNFSYLMVNLICFGVNTCNMCVGDQCKSPVSS